MGISASSLLDETKSNYIRGQTEAELKEFSPYYRKQFSVARFSQVEDDLEQQKEKITQLLKHRESPEAGAVLYEDLILFFDETRKWKERYVVVRANYCLECHDSLETFVKGVPPRQTLLPTGGAVLTTEEKYMAMVDKCFPDDTNVKEDFAPPLSGMPGQFPVYLRLPYRRDSYFCFKQQAKQTAFLSILSDCIRHQNQDFLKKKTCEVQAFLKAIQLYREDRGQYEAWDMLIGSDVRVMANLVMEKLLPSLEKDMLPKLKAKKTERKRVWFATVEAAYILIQEHLLEGLSALKEDCRMAVRQQEVLIHSDMDQILESRRQLEEKVKAKVLEPAEKLSSESVQPYLGSVLEELMEPISSGFQEGCQLSESLMDQVIQETGGDNEQVKKALANMARPDLQICYQKIGSLQEKLKHLQERFGFQNITGVIHSAQIDLQQLMENASFTFEQLYSKAVQDNPDNAGSAIEKAKHRVLKQYDYDSSTVRKKISRDALVSITLPFTKKSLASTCKAELQDLEQTIYSDHVNYVTVDNVYESILLQILDKEVTKVVKEAASLKKYNLFNDSRDLLSQSSRSSLSSPSPSASTPGSPSMALASPKTSSEPLPPSPLAMNGVSSSPEKGEEVKETDALLQNKASADVTLIKTPLGEVEKKEEAQSVPVSQVDAEVITPEVEDVFETVKEEAEAAKQSETNEDNTAAAPETVIREEAVTVITETVEESAEPQTQSSDAPAAETAESELPAVLESLKTDVEAAAEAAQVEAPATSPDPANEPVNTTEESPGSQTAAGEEEVQCASSESKLEAPSSGEIPAVTPADVSKDLERQEAEPAPASDPNSLDVSVGSESSRSDVESTEEVKATPSSEDEVSTTSDVLDDEANLSKSPVSSDEPAEEKSTSADLSPQAQTETESVSVSGVIEAGATVGVESPVEAADVKEETPASPEAPPPDSIKEIRDLVVEVIEVEELVQRYPSGVPKEE